MARRIAVIDDDGAIRDLLAEVLADEGYEPLLFADSEAALLDGWALLALLWADPALCTLPVLVCTGDERAVRE